MKKTLLRCACAAALACGVAGPASAGELKLTMQGGRVTIIADNVPLRQILQEWARVGQTKIVNADKMSGPAMSLQLIDAPERDALDILLRSASGYIAAPRPVPVANMAYYDRVTIMPTSRAPAATTTNMAAPTFQRPPVQLSDMDDEPINGVMTPPGLNPVNVQYPGLTPGLMQQGQGQMQPGPAQPLTSPRPGAVQAPPPQPGMMPNPYQPMPIVRPPGAPPLPGGRGGGPGGQQ